MINSKVFVFKYISTVSYYKIGVELLYDLLKKYCTLQDIRKLNYSHVHWKI